MRSTLWPVICARECRDDVSSSASDRISSQAAMPLSNGAHKDCAVTVTLWGCFVPETVRFGGKQTNAMAARCWLAEQSTWTDNEGPSCRLVKDEFLRRFPFPLMCFCIPQTSTVTDANNSGRLLCEHSTTYAIDLVTCNMRYRHVYVFKFYQTVAGTSRSWGQGVKMSGHFTLQTDVAKLQASSLQYTTLRQKIHFVTCFNATWVATTRTVIWTI